MTLKQGRERNRNTQVNPARDIDPQGARRRWSTRPETEISKSGAIRPCRRNDEVLDHPAMAGCLSLAPIQAPTSPPR